MVVGPHYRQKSRVEQLEAEIDERILTTKDSHVSYPLPLMGLSSSDADELVRKYVAAGWRANIFSNTLWLSDPFANLIYDVRVSRDRKLYERDDQPR